MQAIKILMFVILFFFMNSIDFNFVLQYKLTSKSNLILQTFASALHNLYSQLVLRGVVVAANSK